MTIQTLLELANPFDVSVKGLGPATVMFLIAGSNTSNPQFIVRLYDTGMVRTVDQNDISIYGNPAAGQSLVPNLPEGWNK